MWLVYSLTFAITSSLGTIVAKKIMKSMDEYAYLFFMGIATVPIMMLIVTAFYSIPKIDNIFILSTVVGTLISILGAILAYRAIKISEISLISPISAFNPLFTTITAYLFLGEKIGLRGVAGISVVVLGAYLLHVTKLKEGPLEPVRALFKHKGVQMSLAAAYIWSITPIFEKTAIAHTSPNVPPFASLMGMVFATSLYGVKYYRKPSVSMLVLSKNAKLFLLVGLLSGIAISAAFMAFSLTNLGYATAVFKLSMIFSVIFGWYFFKERNIKEKLLGSAVMLSGVILLVS